MTIDTSYGTKMDSAVLTNYLHGLVNKFFKILPIREAEDGNLKTYMTSLQLELLGCGSLVASVDADAMYMTLLCILQSLIDHIDLPVATYRREVFKAISVCNKLKDRYAVPACGEGDE